MSFTLVEKSILLAAYYRGNLQDDCVWTSNSDQILTLSLFFSGDITSTDCVTRFATHSHVQSLYGEDGKLTKEIETRYEVLINLLKTHEELIEGGGDFDLPADPTYTACRLTDGGLLLAVKLVGLFPDEPNFPNWPDPRTPPDGH